MICHNWSHRDSTLWRDIFPFPSFILASSCFEAKFYSIVNYHHGVYYVIYMSCRNIASITITTNKSLSFSYFFYKDYNTFLYQFSYLRWKQPYIKIVLFWIIPKYHFCKLNNFPQNLNLIIISLLLRFQSWSSEFPQPYLYFNIYSCTLVQ